MPEQTYIVAIAKDYFPKAMRPVGIAAEFFDVVKVHAGTRGEAARKAWGGYGAHWLALMGPPTSKLPRKVSLHVNDPAGGRGGLASRLTPILVYTGTATSDAQRIGVEADAQEGPSISSPQQRAAIYDYIATLFLLSKRVFYKQIADNRTAMMLDRARAALPRAYYLFRAVLQMHDALTPDVERACEALNAKLSSHFATLSDVRPLAEIVRQVQEVHHDGQLYGVVRALPEMFERQNPEQPTSVEEAAQDHLQAKVSSSTLRQLLSVDATKVHDARAHEIAERMNKRGVKLDIPKVKEKIAQYDELAKQTGERKYKVRASMLRGYLKRVAPDGRIYPTYKDNWAEGGRFACEDPNLQNLMKEDRDILCADRHFFVSLDYKQIEPRVMAYISQDPKMVTAFVSGVDVYQVIADNAKCSRQQAKVIVVGAPYGLGSATLAAMLEINQSEAQRIIDNYHRSFPHLWDWIRSKKHGFSEFPINNTTELGHAFNHEIPPEVVAGDTKKEYLWQNKMFATFVQGGAADILKRAMNALDHAGFDITLSTHDEVTYESSSSDPDEVKAEAERAAEIMRHPPGVPQDWKLDVEVVIKKHWSK